MKKMSFYRHIIAIGAMACMTSGALAQSITESVTVEGHYTPEIIPADRLALLPATVALKAPESPMAYDRKGVAADFAPDALNMPATGWRSVKGYDTSRGYLDLRLGSWLNASLSAGFSAISSEDTRLNVYLQHNSTSLWQAWKADAGKGVPAGADRRYRYDETIGADLTHRLPGLGTITGDLQYHYGNFNYYGTMRGPVEDGRIKAPSQSLNDFHARAGWTGEGLGKLTYSGEADVRYFGYSAVYMAAPAEYDERGIEKSEGNSETAVNVAGKVRYRLNENSQTTSGIGISLRYSGVLNHIGNDVNRVEAKPAYTLSGRSYTLRLGANLAVTANGESTRFRAAPDVSFSVRKGIAAFSATAGGGTSLRTLAWMHMMDYYSDPGAGCHEAAYTPLDVRVALQLNPGGRWTWGMEGEWRTTLDESFGGLYQAFLNNDLSSYGSYPESGRIRGFSVGINAGYEICRYLSLKGRASWQPQDGSKGFLNGFDRPEFTADITAESSPIDKLSLRLDYHLRAKRLLLPGNLSRLGLSADYRVSDRLSVGIELCNILNRHEEFLPGLAMEGFNAMGGVQVVF